jgi:rubrerythrin
MEWICDHCGIFEEECGRRCPICGATMELLP